MEDLLHLYDQRKNEIKNSLEEFSKVKEMDGRRMFSELVFCLCTPQSKATMCWDAVKKLNENGTLVEGSNKKIEKILKGVRFHKTKAKRIVRAREKFFADGNFKIKKVLEGTEDDKTLREWLVKNVEGFGMKEASHFMRNVGRGENVAILDRHILRNLHKHGILDNIPETMTERKYVEIETKMKDFADNLGIPLAELDILFWSKETGFIFK